MNKIMAHVVAGYPNEKSCIEIMKSMNDAGVQIIEVQVPFSDPIADGETIMRANDQAIEQGMTTKKSFQLIKKAREDGVFADVYIMTYVQKMISFGFDKFCQQAKKSGAKGLIIPDLPFDSSDYREVKKAARAQGLNIVPVVSPHMADGRLLTASKDAELVYLTSMRGITGKHLVLTSELRDTARQIKLQKPNLKLAIGFGLENKRDVEQVLSIADIAVIGSSVIRKININGQKAAAKFIEELVGF